MIDGVFLAWSSAKSNPKFSYNLVLGLAVVTTPELTEKAVAVVARVTVRKVERGAMVVLGWRWVGVGGVATRSEKMVGFLLAENKRYVLICSMIEDREGWRNKRLFSSGSRDFHVSNWYLLYLLNVRITTYSYVGHSQMTKG